MKRLRQIRLARSIYNTLPADFEEMGTVLGTALAVYDLVVDSVRPNGDRVDVFVHSESFEPESCLCRAPIMAAPELPGRN
jgi:hypothetical protein